MTEERDEERNMDGVAAEEIADPDRGETGDVEAAGVSEPVTEAGSRDAVLQKPGSIAPALEALLLATGEPLSTSTLAHLVGRKPSEVLMALEVLRDEYASPQRGLMVVEIAGGWQFGTKPAHAPLIEKMLKEVRHVRLSPAALETLAIVAYRQPITRAEIEAIRGVNVDGVLSTLMDRELVKMVGRKEEVGRPVLYGTSEAFLKHFGLRSLGDLPPLSEFEEIARARADIGDEVPGPDWHALSDDQRSSLEQLQQAADRELADLDARLRELKPPRVKTESASGETGEGNLSSAEPGTPTAER